MVNDGRAQWQIDQGRACSCGGSDDYCPCQNVQRVEPARRVNFRNAYGLASYLDEIARSSRADLVVVNREAILAALRLVKDHPRYTAAKRNAKRLLTPSNEESQTNGS